MAAESSDSEVETKNGLLNFELWNPFDLHVMSYIRSPMQQHFATEKSNVICRALRLAVVDLLDTIDKNNYREDDTTIIGTEHRTFRSRHYHVKIDEGENITGNTFEQSFELDVSALAPLVFYQLRNDIGISNEEFRHSFAHEQLRDFTNPGKSGSLMYKTNDDLYIIKTLRDYEARLLIQILPGYHIQLTHRSTILNRYVGLYAIRFPKLLSTPEIYVVVMVNALPSYLKINEIYDLKGSTIGRRSRISHPQERLHALKDLDFLEFYPNGIRIPSKIYHRLQKVILNDAKALRKLNITDFSLILGVHHIDVNPEELAEYHPALGLSALFHMSKRFYVIDENKTIETIETIEKPNNNEVLSYLKPLKIIGYDATDDHFYDHDMDDIGLLTCPIPGIINNTNNQRVYIYIAFVDMLQTFDSFKLIEATLKKISDPYRTLQYSVIEPKEYEKRITKFLFEKIFIDAENDFQWVKNDQVVLPIEKETKSEKRKHKKHRHHKHKQSETKDFEAHQDQAEISVQNGDFIDLRL
ncbi:unnamed protein product [Didymodactylos carnosus]|uniref:PIPK domain-containing protein n=1 Tax=Didymodactylos carnosus TaxID=1234261 RepID=A0A813QFV5_9BILA|nr:unnamed protein product [Didymodactylos carnosus]CAF0766831.1 unnamed protein product [Didymodactylos carnosus]CAF3504828.1 unnamed protein product [Didymodactylos carnosus]CAF3548402.1 unnamed protein product [Didymodactylos carnosus]